MARDALRSACGIMDGLGDIALNSIKERSPAANGGFGSALLFDLCTVSPGVCFPTSVVYPFLTVHQARTYAS